jgi:hypothetical protein
MEKVGKNGTFSMCQFKFFLKEIEYSIEDKVKFLFLLNFLCLHFVFEFVPNIE